MTDVNEYKDKFLALKTSYKAAVSIVVLSLLWIASGVFSSSGKDALENKNLSLQKVRVKTVYAEEIPAEIVIHGRTEANKKVSIKAETSGKVIAIGTDKGSPVSKGDLILKLEDNERLERLKEAKSLLTQRNIEFNAAKKLSQKGFNSKVKLAQATTERDSALTALKTAKLDVKNASITAPFDGILNNRTVEEGDYVSPGTIVASVISLNPIKIAADLPEKIAAKVEKGATGTAHLITGQTIEGTVTYVASSAVPQTRTYAIELEAPNPDNTILDGLTLELKLLFETVKTHKISPAILTLNDMGKIGVKTVNSNSIVEFYPIEIIKQTPDGMWIKGLPEEAVLITTGQEFVKVGSEVIAVTEQEVEKAILENMPENPAGDE